MSDSIGQPSAAESSSQDDTAKQISATLRLPEAARSKDVGASWMEVCHKWGFEIVRERVVYVDRNDKSKESAQEQFVVSVVRPHGSASDLADRSPARRAGLKVGDIVVSLAGKPNLSPKDLYTLLKETSDELQICVQRRKNGKEDRPSTAKGTLVAAPATSAAPTAIRRERVTVQIPKAEVYLGTDSAEEVGEANVKADPNDAANRPMHESGGRSIDSTDSSSAVPAQASLTQQPDAPKRALKPAPDVGPGWKIFEVERKGDIKTKGRVDRYWVSPSGKKFRSGKEIERYQETLKATNGDEKAAWSAAKSPPRTKASNQSSFTASAIGDTKNGNLHPDLLRLIDLHEDWDTVGNKKKSLPNGYIYNCEGGKSVRIESANIVDVAEILCQTRLNVGNGTIDADPDQVLIETNKLCKEAREEEASFLQSLQDEVSRADEGTTGSASASNTALTSTKQESEEDCNANMKEECEGRKEETNNQEGSEASRNIPKRIPDSQSIQAEAVEMPIEEKNSQSSAQNTSTAPSESRPRSESQSEAKAKPSIASLSGVAFGAKKIGSGSSKNTRQKRLWPDSFIFRKRVMKWCPPDVVKQAGGPVRFLGPLRQQARTRGASVDVSNEADVPQSSEAQSTALAPIPSTIHTVAEMLKVMSPHILEEGRAQVNRDYEEHSDSDSFWTRTTYEASLVTCTPVERKTSSSSAQRVYEFGFHLSQKDISRIQNNIDDLFVIHASKWDSIACIGMIGPRDEHTTTYLKDQRHRDGPQADFRLWITASKNPCGGTGWLAQADVPAVVPGGGIESQRAFMMHIGSASDIMRQYEGMKSLSFVKDHLQRAVFCSGDTNKRNRALSMDSIGATSAGAATSALDKPTTIPDYVWRKIRASLNQIQLRSIHRIMEGKSRENVALLQGPPGTGKTTTICHLVSALLNGACPKPGSKMAGVRVHIGKSISTASSKGDKGTKALNRAANRILVCAASNAAVDELAWKIHKHSIAGDGRSGVTKIIRYGFLPWERAGGKGDSQLSRNSGSERDRFLAKINYDAQVSNAQHRKLLSDCDVVCATLSGLGSKGFIDAVSKDESNTGSEFDAIIIDEACQATEAACLIPLKYNPNLLVLVGDPQQLPAFVASQECEKNMFGRSLFERLQEQGWGVDMLHIQCEF